MYFSPILSHCLINFTKYQIIDLLLRILTYTCMYICVDITIHEDVLKNNICTYNYNKEKKVNSFYHLSLNNNTNEYTQRINNE